MSSTKDKEIEFNLRELGYLDVPVNPKLQLAEEIRKLAKEKNAIILAHYYQIPEIQEVADFVGDSLGLAKKAAETKAELIVFAGVQFMAETAKIINPEKKVVLPDQNAGCSLSDACRPDDFSKFIDAHPNHIVITYVNCSVEIKALSDIICTSSNAVKIIESVPKDRPIIFAPDENLGKYLQIKTGRDLVLWSGSCIVHESFSLDKLLELHKAFPEAKIIAHPESETHILDVASYIGSTAGLIKFAKEDNAKEFIVATEAGILHEMKKQVPDKNLIPAPVYEENSCSCSECAFMKLNTMEKLYNCLKYEKPEVSIPAKLMAKALAPIEKMLELS